MKHLRKLFYQDDLPWVQLIWEKHYQHSATIKIVDYYFRWRDCMKLIPAFMRLASCHVNDGGSFCYGKISGLPPLYKILYHISLYYLLRIGAYPSSKQLRWNHLLIHETFHYL
jgi:hypothetical protein